jgi:feruloyl esterase
MFMLPGVLHCTGGPGPGTVDWLEAIVEWVEEDQAPARLIASRIAGGEVEMRRPLCAYPAKAVYDGTGDANREESFECVAP